MSYFATRVANVAITPHPRGLRTLCMVLAFGFSFAGAWFSRPPLVGLQHDDAVYAITARALANGEGYRLTNLPGRPTQTKYPPVFPLLLAAVWRVVPEFPANVPWLTLVPAFGAGICATAAWAYGVTLGLGASESLVLALASLSVPYWLLMSGSLMSESWFTALVLGVLARLRSLGREARSADWGVAALLALAVLTRSVGMGVLAGVLGALWWQRRMRWRIALAAMAPVALWLIWSRMAAETDGSAALYYTNYVEWFREALTLDMLRNVVAEHIAHFSLESALMQCDGLATLLPFPMRRPLLLLALGSIMWSGGLIGCRRDLPALGAVLGYMALVLVWPWPIGRFLLPLFPILWMNGSAVFLARGGPARRAVLVAAAALVLVTNGWLVVTTWRTEQSSGRAYSEPEAPRTAEYAAMFSWIQRHVPADASVSALLDTTVALYTGRTTIPVYQLSVSRAAYLVRSPTPDWLPYAEFDEHVEALVGDGTLVNAYRGKDDRFEVLEIRRPVAPLRRPRGPLGPPGPTSLISAR